MRAGSAGPDLELRVLSARGAEHADHGALIELASRLDEPGDRFLVDVALRRIAGDMTRDEELRRRGLALYRTTPFSTYRAALAELGETGPAADIVVPPKEASADAPVYSLQSTLDLIETLKRQAGRSTANSQFAHRPAAG